MNKSLLALSVGLAFSGSVNAAMITLQDNVADSIYVNGGSLNGQFNLSTALNSNYYSPYQVNSATFKFTFVDDSIGEIIYNGQNTYNTGTGYSGHNTYNYRNTTHSYYDAYEGAELGILGTYVQGASSSYYNTGSIYTGQQTYATGFSPHYYSYSCGWFSTCYEVDHYDYTYQVTNFFDQTLGYKGTFSIEGSLTGTALNNFKTSGIFDYHLRLSGDMFFNNAELYVDISPNPSKVSVPEPSGLLLFGLGALGLAARRRLKQK